MYLQMQEKIRASLFEKGAVCHEVLDGEGGWLIDVSIDQPSLERIFRDSGNLLSMIQ